MPDKSEAAAVRHGSPSTVALWVGFILSVTSLAVPLYFRCNALSILAAVSVSIPWTWVGRRWYREGFHQTFDMLAMFSYLASFVAVAIALYRFWL